MGTGSSASGIGTRGGMKRSGASAGGAMHNTTEAGLSGSKDSGEHGGRKPMA